MKPVQTCWMCFPAYLQTQYLELRMVQVPEHLWWWRRYEDGLVYVV